MEKHINLKNYLKQILDLEIEKNRLEQIESKIQILINNNLNPIDKNKYIDFDEIEKKKSNEIQQYKDKNKIKKPVIPKKPEEPTKLKPNPLILLIVGIIEFILGIGIDFAFVYVLGGFIAVLSFFGVVSQISINNNYKKQIEIYENALLNYNNESADDIFTKKYNVITTNSTAPTARPVTPIHLYCCVSGLNVVNPTIPSIVAANPINIPKHKIPTIENIKLNKQDTLTFFSLLTLAVFSVLASADVFVVF